MKMKKLFLIAIVFSGMLIQAQDTVTMKNGKLYIGKVQVISGKNVQIIDGGRLTQVPSKKVKKIKYDNSLHKNYEWEEVVQVNGSKKDLYEKAQFIIADIYVSANSVVQSSNENSGIIVKAKARVSLSVNWGMHVVKYYFPYTLKVVFKDNKYKLTIDNVGFGDPTDHRWANIPATDMYDGDVWTYGVTRNQHAEAMRMLKRKLSAVVSVFRTDMQQELSVNNDW